jgi:carbamoylphosphate synthase small subunit
MEIVNIEARTFEAMMTRFETLEQKMNSLHSEQDKSLKKWLDNQDVCLILNISKRTLQTYRDNGTLPYSQINHKIYYKPNDIELVIRNLLTSK